ncbi:hypothetical protein CK203_091247 [Vitis vinifera]|uniref:Uncharacterized protein n=1 Tax=Vitis vinifera TaxID=29760 RepID=A0A438EMF0_VITVI|nr:hypothetical protein CK203_091247 [Vitis vinifera]
MLAMEALSCLHERARKGGHLLSFTMRSKGGKERKFPICCLLTILSEEQVDSNWRVENMEDMALNIGYKVGNPSSTYLGLPLVPSVNQWQLGMGGRIPFKTQRKEVNRRGEDKVIWLESKSRTLYVKSPGKINAFLMGVVWNSLAQPKASFFA